MTGKRFAAIALLAAMVLGCGSGISTNYDFDERADFKGYRTFDWMPRPVPTAGSAQQAMQNNDLLDGRIKRAVNSELIQKGLNLTGNAPDLVVVYHTGVADKVNVTDWGYSYGAGAYWGGPSRDVTVTNYQEGTLIIDLIDASTNQLVWRGSGTGALSSNPTPEQLDKNISEAVKQILRAYPPKN